MFFPSRRHTIRAFLAVALLPCSALVVSAQDAGTPSSDRIEKVLSSVNRGHSVGQVAVSPDGRRLAWIEGGRRGGEIRVAALDNLAKSERVTAAATADQHCT